MSACDLGGSSSAVPDEERVVELVPEEIRRRHSPTAPLQIRHDFDRGGVAR
jgi:hypothetical protein